MGEGFTCLPKHFESKRLYTLPCMENRDNLLASYLFQLIVLTVLIKSKMLMLKTTDLKIVLLVTAAELVFLIALTLIILLG